jgi:transposase
LDERLRFLARVLDGEPMTEVCRDFGISRKTGYKVFDRYKEHGLEALSGRSRRPVDSPISCRPSPRRASSAAPNH